MPRPDQIIQVMLLPEQQNLMKNIIKEFYGHDYGDIPTGVKNAALMFAIMKTQEIGSIPNAAYLRKVMETFEANGVKTISQAIHFLESHKSYQNKQAKAIAEPEWMDDYVKRVASMEQ